MRPRYPVVASFAKHPIITDDYGIVGLRRLEATLLDAALEGAKARQLAQRTAIPRTVAGDEMDEAAVGEPQGEIANAIGRFYPQFLEYALDQPFIFLRLLRFR